MPKDKILRWIGGSYPGCAWEPNLGFFDSDGEWHPVISTGCGAVNDQDLADRLAKAADEGTEIDSSWDYGPQLYDIDKKGTLMLYASVRSDFVLALYRELYNAGYDNMWYECAQCGAETEYGDRDEYVCEERFYSAHGDGGIGMVYDGLICNECYDASECSMCGEFGRYDQDEHGMCADCQYNVQWFIDSDLTDMMCEHTENPGYKLPDFEAMLRNEFNEKDDEGLPEYAVEYRRHVRDRLKTLHSMLWEMAACLYSAHNNEPCPGFAIECTEDDFIKFIEKYGDGDKDYVEPHDEFVDELGLFRKENTK